MLPIRNPPGRWVPEHVRDPREIRAAAARLPRADDRGRVVRREEVHHERVPAALVNDEQAAWFHLERAWVYPSQVYTPDGERRPRITRSRSPPPFRPHRHEYPYGDHRDLDARCPDEHGNRSRDPYDSVYQQQYEDRYRYLGVW